MAVKVLLSLLTVTDLCAAEPRLFEPDPFTSGQQLRGRVEESDPFGEPWIIMETRSGTPRSEEKGREPWPIFRKLP